MERDERAPFFGKDLAAGSPALVIAEAGVNHNGDLATAEKLIEVAAAAGADVVKFQTLDAAGYISRFAPKAQYQKQHTDSRESQVDMVRKYELSRGDHERLIERCRQAGIAFFSTAFDESSVDLLDGLGVECFKIPSGEIDNLPLLAHIATKAKPVILSTGMADLGEVERALAVLRANGAADVAVLHCVSNYPTRYKDLNLRAIETMHRAFGIPVGLSDHTLGIEASVAAVALGAKVIEKHYTLDRGMAGPDHQASLEPDEFRGLVEAIRNVEMGLGDGIKQPAASERNTKDVARKSLVAAERIVAGTTLTESMLLRKRPGTGIAPDQLEFVVGRVTRRSIQEDEILSWDMLA